MNSLRSGHTWITHNFLMNGTTTEPPPVCPMCKNDVFNVPHILLKRAQVEELRINNIKAYRKKSYYSAELLDDRTVATDVLRLRKSMDMIRFSRKNHCFVVVLVLCKPDVFSGRCEYKSLYCSDATM